MPIRPDDHGRSRELTDISNPIFIPDALFVPLHFSEERFIQLQESELPIVLYGNLHMLNWPSDEAEQGTLLSRCTDHVLERPPVQYRPEQVYAVYAGPRPDDAAVAWAQAVLRLNRAPVIKVVVADAGVGWSLNYFPVERPQARVLGRLAAKAISQYQPQLH